MHLFGGRCWQASRNGRQLALNTEGTATKAPGTDTWLGGLGSSPADSKEHWPETLEQGWGIFLPFLSMRGKAGLRDTFSALDLNWSVPAPTLQSDELHWEGMDPGSGKLTSVVRPKWEGVGDSSSCAIPDDFTNGLLKIVLHGMRLLGFNPDSSSSP